MKTDIHLQVLPVPTTEDREKGLALAIQWHRSDVASTSEVLDTARRFAEFIVGTSERDREGICGDESTAHPFNCTGTLPAVCHLRFGHGSRWHESETGQRWKYGDYSSAFPATSPVERGPAHDPPPGLS
jgi:hypothetical protein